MSAHLGPLCLVYMYINFWWQKVLRAKRLQNGVSQTWHLNVAVEVYASWNRQAWKTPLERKCKMCNNGTKAHPLDVLEIHFVIRHCQRATDGSDEWTDVDHIFSWGKKVTFYRCLHPFIENPFTQDMTSAFKSQFEYGITGGIKSSKV